VLSSWEWFTSGRRQGQHGLRWRGKLRLPHLSSVERGNPDCPHQNHTIAGGHSGASVHPNGPVMACHTIARHWDPPELLKRWACIPALRGYPDYSFSVKSFLASSKVAFVSFKSLDVHSSYTPGTTNVVKTAMHGRTDKTQRK
jgi:hypothetical protein